MQLDVNLFCRDIEAQLRFYAALLAAAGATEAVHSRSAIYRALQGPGWQFGFHASPAYGLLGLGDRAALAGSLPPTTCYATFMLGDVADVEAGAARTPPLGGRVVKPPYPTYYGHWQAVLADPEGHVFRLGCARLPDGVARPTLQPSG